MSFVSKVKTTLLTTIAAHPKGVTMAIALAITAGTMIFGGGAWASTYPVGGTCATCGGGAWAS